MNEEKFSADEMKLLRSRISFYEQLHEGTREATTDAQRRFVRVCNGLEQPITPDEKVYRKLLAIQKESYTPRPRFSTNAIERPGGLSRNPPDNWDYSAIK